MIMKTLFKTFYDGFHFSNEITKTKQNNKNQNKTKQIQNGQYLPNLKLPLYTVTYAFPHSATLSPTALVSGSQMWKSLQCSPMDLLVVADGMPRTTITHSHTVFLRSNKDVTIHYMRNKTTLRK